MKTVRTPDLLTKAGWAWHATIYINIMMMIYHMFVIIFLQVLSPVTVTMASHSTSVTKLLDWIFCTLHDGGLAISGRTSQQDGSHIEVCKKGYNHYNMYKWGMNLGTVY